MTDTAMCALIIQLWLGFRAATQGPPKPRQIRWTKAALLAAPYVSLLAFSLLALAPTPTFIYVGSSKLLARPANFYCMLLRNNALLITQYTVLLTIIAVALAFDVWVIRILYRHWRYFHRTGEQKLEVPLSVVLRVVIFCVYRVMVAVAYGSVLVPWAAAFGKPSALLGIIFPGIPVWVDMLQASTPLVALLIFSTKREFLDILMFWRRGFSPVILDTLMFWRRRSPVTQRASNAHGDDESVVSIGTVLDIRQETQSAIMRVSL
ncbi:hypothetical protein JB92DRAFT_458106 [Gautieria morchelliformis]|nr:hypothetical protein JB92DRAFT_458106 [Gautieria morchelliformis]